MLISFHEAAEEEGEGEEEEEEEDREQYEMRKFTFSMATDRQSASAANGERRETFLRGKENAHWTLQAVAVTQEDEDVRGNNKGALGVQNGGLVYKGFSYRRRARVQALPWFEICARGRYAKGTGQKSRKGLYSGPFPTESRAGIFSLFRNSDRLAENRFLQGAENTKEKSRQWFTYHLLGLPAL